MIARGALGGTLVAVACAACLAEPDEADSSPRGALETAVPVETVTVEAAPRSDIPSPVEESPASGPRADAATVTRDDVEELASRGLIVPVAGVSASELPDTFSEMRGERPHAALDIPAPRGTPVLSADDGTILKLFTSRAGGLTIYVGDRAGKFIYYYAHLDAYEPGLLEGQAVAKGQRLGAVGTTGNAPPNVPHLHFAIMRANDMRRWWEGAALDPRPILRTAAR